MKQLLIILAATAFFFTAVGQETRNQSKSRKEIKRQRINAMIKLEEEGVIAYKKHFGGGIKLTSDGYGIFVEKGIAKSVKKAMLFQIDISQRKHQKEEKQNNPNGQAAPLIYGKINFFYPVKLGVQMQFLLGNKGNKNGVSITANVGGGLVVGLLRPYYVEVDKVGVPTFVKYDSPDSTLFLSGPFYGGPRFGRGWSGLKVTPGIYIKPALRFDFGRYNEMLSAFEVGLTGEFYTKKIPQMVYQKQKQFFFGAYFAFTFGKRK